MPLFTAEIATAKEPTLPSAVDSPFSPPAPARGAWRSRGPGSVAWAAVVAGMVASTGLVTSPVAAVTTSKALGRAGPAPGTIFIANAGADAFAAAGTGPGSVTLYRPGARGNARPEAVLTVGIDGPAGVATDSSGDLWVANDDSVSAQFADVPGTVVEYGKSELADASPVPTVTIKVPHSPLEIAFDPSGDLWLDYRQANTVVELAKAQLARSGSPEPRVSLRVNPDDCGVAFDPSGNLWVGSDEDWLSEWAKAELTKSGAPAPQVTISSDTLAAPCRPTFDSLGNLWVGSYDGSNAVEFTKAELVKSGSQAPRVNNDSMSLFRPGQLAVSASGSLWVPNAEANTVVEFARRQLVKSGFPSPVVTIAGPAAGLNWPLAVAIEP